MRKSLDKGKSISDNNFAPYWVEVGKAIDAEADQLAMIIRQFQTYRYAAYR